MQVKNFKELAGLDRALFRGKTVYRMDRTWYSDKGCTLLLCDYYADDDLFNLEFWEYYVEKEKPVVLEMPPRNSWWTRNGRGLTEYPIDMFCPKEIGTEHEDIEMATEEDCVVVNEDVFTLEEFYDEFTRVEE